ncbi:Mediator of RNA polymerase II transcription subunit 15a [Vitis vinifera]|uniref:Mediator of RNA polymerase II transcription subunit 15a n=1 Tax=Vitis vinifera TaxID=29760 RepID=A0A438IBE9_VITVI|nr:Mediator of RNA polymerase II transcription subunit 15a [Vitis vinifera]RVW94022.1 Mediator of RNA polymerase II transcription subunit 15a [Vitis vinifera]
MDGGDWRAHVPPDARQRIVNYIMDTLKRVVPVSGPEQLHQLRNLAERFEEKHYSAATSRYDYLWRLAAKLLTLEGLAKTNYAAQSKKSSDGNRSSDDQKFSAIKESLRSRDRVVYQHLYLDDAVSRPHQMALCTHEFLFNKASQ